MRKLTSILKLSAFILFLMLMASCLKKNEDPYASYTPAREAGLIKDWLAKVKLEKIHLDSTTTGIYYIADTTKIGSGPTVKAGNTVTTKYICAGTDGTVFDASSLHNPPTMVYKHKTQPLIQGWEEGIEVLNKGSRATFLIPSAKGYGAYGSQDGSIPPNTPLIFTIEVVDIK